MKMDVFAKHCVIAVTFLATVAFTACDDQNFDWEKAKSENAEYNYAQRFESLFGAIDPTQNWDFSDIDFASMAKTRANANPIYSMNDAISQAELDSRWTDDWYYVEKATINKIIEYLPEGGTNVTKTINGRAIGSAFVLEVPDCGFKITPIFQGANEWHPTSYIDVSYTDENGVTTSKTYRLWGEGEHIECIPNQNKTTCTYCNGTGKVADIDGITSGEIVGSYTIQSKYNNGTTYYYLNGKKTENSSSKFAVVKDLQNILHLYSVSSNAYLVANTSDGDLATTTSLESASSLIYTNNGNIKLGNVYLYVKDSRPQGQLRKSSTDSRNDNYCWTWTETSLTDNERQSILNTLFSQKQCPNCSGTGKTLWKSPGTSTAGTTVQDKWTALDNIRGNSLVFQPNDLPVGATIAFKTVVTQGVNDTPRPEPSNVTQGYYKYTSGTKTNYFYSTAQTGSPYILALDIPKPSNITATSIVNGEEVPHEVMVIACEGGNNSDMNEVLFIIEGDPYLPKVRDTNGFKIIESKRYMVEDMGYSANGTEAVIKGYTDIDFNDIVIDFSKSRKYKDYYNGTKFIRRELLDEYKYDATIRALGGTWDFILKVGGTPVFQKSKSKNTAQTIRLNNQNITLPKVTFNTNYIMNEGTSSASPLTEEGPLNSAIIYNTNQNSTNRGDGHWSQDLQSNQSYICTITSDKDNNTAISNWNPTANNIEFLIIDTQYGPGFNNLYDSSKEEANGENVTSSSKNVYTFGFPAVGATPKIVAFPNTLDEDGQIINVKQWQREKNPVSSTWFPSR